MRKFLAATALCALVAGPAAYAAVNQTLPNGVITQLGTASTPGEIAALALSNPDLAPTIICQAQSLGVGTPDQVVSAAETTNPSAVQGLVRAAVECSPANGEGIARAGLLLLNAAPGQAPGIADTAVQGLVDAGVDNAVIARESAEIASALFALVPPATQGPVAEAIAQATPDTTDTAGTIVEAADGIETAGPLLPFGDRRARPLSRVPSFVQLPTAASPN
ncbi:MAG: hypothetical protein AAGF79_18420 [Pseudomonadota bacterium]